ncbi:DedA family protein [Propionimicrobium sp. PCR01-08-3]|uniref:DedA family protein n=1 Tax=Propionimicrobium sp. PCR01-08-3 TaxID=3052086 RepID=UPI00255CB4AE|nr:DedA family protein [Propionimicrobium sp. PCR01-08-3]WIY83568.1 DedA family protein [Propionimicrobium sp. PCR01-08-3]
MDILNDLILQAAASPWLLLVMFGVAVIDGFFPPIPSETVLVAAAAAAVSTGDLGTIVWLCVVAAIGAAIGDNVAFRIGKSVGVERFRWTRRPKVAAAVARARRSLERRGAAFILGGRYIPVGRVAINMTAGAMGYPWARFAPISIVAGVTWAIYSTLIGVFAGHWLGGQPLLSAAVGIMFALVIGWVIDLVGAARRHNRANKQAQRDHEGAQRAALRSDSDTPRSGERSVRNPAILAL